MEHRVGDDPVHLQPAEVQAVNVINVRHGDGDGDGENGWERHLDDVQMEEMRLANPQVAMLLDAPHEPPIELHHMLEPVNVPERPRKKRSFLTISKPFLVQPERCALISNGWRAVQCVPPEKRGECFANYLIKHMNSRNYPNGEGLPTRWGQF